MKVLFKMLLSLSHTVEKLSSLTHKLIICEALFAQTAFHKYVETD